MGVRALLIVALLASSCSDSAPAAGPVVEAPMYLSRVDHLVYAAPDLDAAIDHVEALLGVRATPGGSHPGRGTRNALLSLGEGTYLEIIAPDPAQPDPASPRWFGIDDLTAPRLVTWAAKGRDLPALVEEARRRGVDLGDASPGSRERPDGVTLSWTYTSPDKRPGGGLVPFFIDWGDSPHPSRSAADGGVLVELRAAHPDPDAVRAMLDAVGLDLPVVLGPEPALVAYIATATGRVALR